MSKRSKQKSVRLYPKTLEEIKSFMENARVLPSREENGRKMISNNLTKAFHYLTRSFFDDRRFKNRALFDGTLGDLEELTTRLINTGNDLNNLNKAYFNSSSSDNDPTAVLKELGVLINENNRLLNLFENSFVLENNGRE